MSDWPDEVPRPPIKARCRVCRPSDWHLEHNGVIVSPQGVAHLGRDVDSGDTWCGKDATPDGWWWPL
jgi:hypothetical protein